MTDIQEIRELIAPFRNCLELNNDLSLDDESLLTFLVNLEKSVRNVLRVCNRTDPPPFVQITAGEYQRRLSVKRYDQSGFPL